MSTSINNIYGASYIRDGKALFDNTKDERILFGKVINIKFTRKYNDESFCIRSDYEAQYGTDGKISFVPCAFKPSIHLSYKQVSNTTSISVIIKVDAMHIDPEAANNPIDRSSENPVMWAEVSYGYIDQFTDWTKAKTLDDAERFFDMNDESVSSALAVSGGKKILVQILNCGPVSNPPDRTYVFNGVVGNFEDGLVWDNNDPTVFTKSNYGDSEFPDGMSKIEAILYQWITRRFVKSSVKHKLDSSSSIKDGVTTYTRKLSIYGYNNYVNNAANDKSWKTIDFSEGILSHDDAAMFGVTCTCSAKLKTMNIDDLFHYGIMGENASVAKGLTEDPTMFCEAMNTLDAQVNAIREHYPFLRWYVNRDGTLFFYHVNETNEDIFKDAYVKSMQKSSSVLLPAIYDITLSGMRIIRCPVMPGIDPMTTVFFQSQYDIVDMTGYFSAPNKNLFAFLVILADVEFATVDDDNMMTLRCVDIDSSVPTINEDTGEIDVGSYEEVKSDFTSNAVNVADSRHKNWTEYTITIGTYPYDKKNFSWIDVAGLVVKDVDPVYWNGVALTLATVLTDLKNWNSGTGVWSDSKLKKSGYGYSPDNKDPRVASLGFKIPWLNTGDKVVIRVPYRPSSTYSTANQQEGVSS